MQRNEMTLGGKSSLLKKERMYIDEHKGAVEEKLKLVGVDPEAYVVLALHNMVDIRPSFPSATGRSTTLTVSKHSASKSGY